ncbi:MAG TPA: 4Fe-4S dicluster domain-containing protein [Desulfosalsimonadaceae bacterium]|nr:4Fe-4S dicluster domain-containing protein [Desulfosalsimonadaceae bacterium]
MKRSFFGFIKPKLTYSAITDSDAEPVSLPVSKDIRLLLDTPLQNSRDLTLSVGEQVKAGQRIQVTRDARDYAMASRSGQVTEINPFLGMMQAQMTAVSIAVDSEAHQVADDEFKAISQSPSLENAARFLQGLPGKPDFSPFFESDRPVKAIVVLGVDQELLSITNQYFVKTSIESIKSGIDILRKLTGIQNVVMAVPEHLVEIAGAAGAGVKTVDLEYPAAHPELILRHMMANELKGGDTTSHADAAFFSAEAVSAIGAAFNTGKLPLEKLVTFISKNGARRLVSVPIGTPLKDILKTFDETIREGDRIIFGGPLTGVAVYATDHPVGGDTDTIMVQDGSQILENADVACINCGECVRICPVNIPVNILIRLLEAEQYEAAAAQAELDACIECGLCAFVCESRIPIFQHIKLAKHTLEQMKAEESHG